MFGLKNKVYTCSKHNYTGTNQPCPDCRLTTNWHLVLQGLYSYKATYKRLEKDNLLKDYELHEYEVIIEAIEELETR